MAARAPEAPTFEQLYAEIQKLPERLTGEILEPGVLHTMSRPGRRHRLGAKEIVRSLAGFDVDHGGTGWWIEVEAEIRFDERLTVPDLAGFRVERVPALPDENPIAIVPDWCCEILSPSTARDDRMLKLPLYAQRGVGFVWLVDPALHTVEVYETVNGRPTLAITVAGAEPATLPPFDGPIALTRWWLPEAPR
jgi:Uma2 family endonuclease